jgi:hypothetical protein
MIVAVTPSVTTAAFINDSATQFTVITDRSEGKAQDRVHCS